MSDQSATKLHDITYRCPGGLTLTYSMTSPSYLRRFRDTWIGGAALWRMWFREVLFLLMAGRIPYPTIVTQNVAGDISRVLRRMKWEAEIKPRRIRRTLGRGQTAARRSESRGTRR